MQQTSAFARSRRSPRRRRGWTGPAAAAVVGAGLVVAAVGLTMREGNGLPDALPQLAHDLAAGDLRAAADGPLGREDGYLAVGESLSPQSSDPAIMRLEPRLREAVRRAAADAQAGGVTLNVTSGWRSARYQQELLDRATHTYGSRAEARRFVKPPEQSSHVTGTAVDIGPTDAASWMSQHGHRYGLCQTYANELWHYELATTAGGVCPASEADASGG